MKKRNMNSFHIRGYADALFACKYGKLSHLGYFIVIADKNNNANIIHNESNKRKWLTRSVLGAKTYAFADEFYF